VPGALAPPLPEPVVPVEVPLDAVFEPVLVVPVPVLVPVEPDCELGAVAVGVADALGVAVADALPLAAASPSELGSDGIVTSTGAPGTSW
jgi:hypothetical protein